MSHFTLVLVKYLSSITEIIFVNEQNINQSGKSSLFNDHQYKFVQAPFKYLSHFPTIFLVTSCGTLPVIDNTLSTMTTSQFGGEGRYECKESYTPHSESFNPLYVTCGRSGTNVTQWLYNNLKSKHTNIQYIT